MGLGDEVRQLKQFEYMFDIIILTAVTKTSSLVGNKIYLQALVIYLSFKLSRNAATPRSVHKNLKMSGGVTVFAAARCQSFCRTAFNERLQVQR